MRLLATFLLLAACRGPVSPPGGLDAAAGVDSGSSAIDGGNADGGDTGPPDTGDGGGETDPDLDGDGHPASVDCDDSDPSSFPGADEVCGDDVDQDCDGEAIPCGLWGDYVLEDRDLGFYGEAYDDSVGDALKVLMVPDVDGDGDDELALGRAYGSYDAVDCGGLHIFRGGRTNDAGLSEADQIVPPSVHCGVGTLMSWGDFDQDGVAEVASLSGGGDDGWHYGAGFIEVDRYGTVDPLDVVTLISGTDAQLIETGYTWREPLGITGSALLVAVAGSEGYAPEGLYLFLPPVQKGMLDDHDVVLLGDDDWPLIASAGDAGDGDGDGGSSVAIVVQQVEGPDSLTGGVAVFDELPTTDIILSDADHHIWGRGTDHDYGGLELRTGGDLDGDGTEDLLIWDAHGILDGPDTCGCLFVFLGQLDADQQLDDAPIRLCGTLVKDYFGYTADASGDLDHDGQQDLVAGRFSVGDVFATDVRLFYGPLSAGHYNSTDSQAVFTSADPYQNGTTAVSGGDFNGDGIDDLVVGAQGDSTMADWGGAALLFYGGER